MTLEPSQKRNTEIEIIQDGEADGVYCCHGQGGGRDGPHGGDGEDGGVEEDWGVEGEDGDVRGWGGGRGGVAIAKDFLCAFGYSNG